jgi:hypothetical protein
MVSFTAETAGSVRVPGAPLDDLNVLEDLERAVSELLTGAAAIQHRLYRAAVCLQMAPPEVMRNEDFRRRLAGIKDDLHFEGDFATTMRATPDEDAAELARRIYDLYRDLERHLHLP